MNEEPNSALQMVFKTNTNRANRIALWALLLEYGAHGLHAEDTNEKPNSAQLFDN